MDRIDLNCDLGESFGAYSIGNDAAILPFVTSANIACGFHAGDPSVMRKTVQLALKNGVALGAHPGLHDLQGFGRKKIEISPQEAYDLVVYQIGALEGFIRAEGAWMQHVKPHGALYNMAAKDKALAEAVANAVYNVNPELILFGLAGSELIRAGKKVGLKTSEEVFADRTYQPDGSLTPRSQPDALIVEDGKAVLQVISMVQQKGVNAKNGSWVDLKADTVCIHGDGTQALLFAKKIHDALTAAGIEVCAAGKK